MYISCKNKYENLADQLREDIQRGVFNAGALPSEQELMKQFQVGRITAYNALKLLAKEGLIKRIKGKGTFINSPGKVLTLSQQVGIIMRKRGHFYNNLYRALEGNLQTKELFPVSVDNDVSQQTALDLLLGSPIQGIIFEGTGYCQFPFLEKTPSINSVAVNYFDAPGDIPGHAVLGDFEQGAFLASSHLVSLGHQKIILFTHKPDIFPVQDQQHHRRHPVTQLEAGYHRAMEENCLQEHEEIVYKHGSEKEKLDDIIRGILARKERPTAFVATRDMIAARIISIAREMGLSIPQDLSVTGMFNTPWSEESLVPITSISFNEQEMAKKAVELLISGKKQKQVIKIAPELISRESCMTNNDKFF